MQKRLALIVALFLFGASLVLTQAQAQSKKAPQGTPSGYEKRQKIDLGSLTIDGDIVGPGDFSIEDEKAKESKFLYKRKNFNDRLRINIQYVF